MGNCMSPGGNDNPHAVNRGIEKDQRKHARSEAKVHKLLLLGPGESGKSTLFRRLKTIYGEGYTDQDRLSSKAPIHANAVLFMKILIEQSVHLKDEDPKCAMASGCSDAAALIAQQPEEAPVTPEIAAAIKRLWADKGIRHCFETHRSLFQVPDSANYFFDKIDELAEPDYCPTEEDCLRSRVRTTGIVETEFELKGNVFKMLDVGGQRNERKKWIHCFDDVTAIIFVVAISEYNQLLFEDERTNRMVESLKLFSEITNSQYFEETSIILFLNKKDLFRIKIEHVPLTVCFQNFKGRDRDYEVGLKFIEEQFVLQNQNKEKDKHIFVHPTCGLDSENVQIVFNSVKDIIITRHLRELGHLN